MEEVEVEELPIDDAAEIKGDAREEQHIPLQVEVVLVVGVFLKELEVLVETMEILEL